MAKIPIFKRELPSAAGAIAGTSGISPNNGNRIFDGIEVDKSGAVVAYHITNHYPYESTVTPYETKRIPAYGRKTGLPNVLHLMRGEIFQIQGLCFLAFGGAYSVDRRSRVLDISWWKDEIPSAEEWANMEKHLAEVDYKVDVVLTHTAPMRFLQPKTKEIGIHWCNFQDEVAKRLSGLEPEIQYKIWYFGHFHLDWVDREQKCRGIYTAIDVIR